MRRKTYCSYVKATKYTQAELDAALLADLQTDYRCALRDGLADYAEECAAKIRALGAVASTKEQE